MLELVFTSAKAGLIPGRSGFCSVAWTEGMPQNLVFLLENMSGYNALYMPNDPKSDQNPVSYSYQKVVYGKNELHILSRIAFAGLDYTGRTNKIAHHIIIEDETELMNLQHGPISAFLCEGNFITEWNEPPRLLPRRTKLNSAQTSGLKAECWESLSGNPQWAGIIADTFLNSDKKSCLYLEYDNETHRDKVLYLIDEIARLLPQEELANFTFTTYFANAQNGTDCFLRAALPNCPALPAIKRFKAKDLISLIHPLPLKDDYLNLPLVVAALTGVKPVDVADVKNTPTESASASPHYSRSPERNSPQNPEKRRFIVENNSRDAEYSQYSHSSNVKLLQSRLCLISLAIAFLTLLAIVISLAFMFMKSGELPQEEIIKSEAWRNENAAKKAAAEKAKAEKAKAEKAAAEKVAAEKAKAEKLAAEKAAAEKAKAEKLAAEKAAAEKAKAEKEAAEKAKAERLAAEKKAAAERLAAQPPQSLSIKSCYLLFKQYVDQRDKERLEIKLPQDLDGVTKIEVKLKEGWSGKNQEYKYSEDNEFYTKKDTLFRVHPIDESTKFETPQRPDTSKSSLTIELQDNKLVFFGKREILKAIEGSVIIFHIPDKVKRKWQLCFEQDFLSGDVIPFGSFNDKNEYQPSPDEDFWKRNRYIKLQGEENLKREIADMQRVNERCKKLRGEIESLKGVKEPKKIGVQEIQLAHSSFEKALKEEREKDAKQTKEIESVKESFNKFYDALCDADDETLNSYCVDFLTTKIDRKQNTLDGKKNSKKRASRSSQKQIDDEIDELEAELKELKEKREILTGQKGKNGKSNYADTSKKADVRNEVMEELFEDIENRLFKVFGKDDEQGSQKLDFIPDGYEFNKKLSKKRKERSENQEKFKRYQTLEEELKQCREYTEADFKKRREDAAKNMKRILIEQGH